MKLFIDIGNSRLKWVYGSQRGSCVLGESLPKQLHEAWFDLARPDSIWACCVAGSKVRAILAEWVNTNWGRVINWMFVELTAGGLVNQYASGQLGADRWFAAIGAWAHTGGAACSIIDAGSAVTVDAVSAEGEFLGGVILPGYRLIREALNQNTSQISAGVDPASAACVALSTTTGEAVESGACFSIAGGVDAALQAQQTQTGLPSRLVFTGGDGAYVLASLRAVSKDAMLYTNAEVLPDLVIAGLQQVATDQRDKLDRENDDRSKND